MKQKLARLSLNGKLALIAFALGLIALFAGNPYQGTQVTLDARELGMIVDREIDHVSVEEVADWIIKGKSDYRLIDLRPANDFSTYHIPTAEHVIVAGLSDYPIQRNEKIILYSEGGFHSAQAWILLRAMKFRGVYILLGGLEEWQDRILFPPIPENPTPEQASLFEKMKEVSKFFGGTPQGQASGTNSPIPALTMPKPEIPPSSSPAIQGKKKKKEGC
jgi:hypothetical protein